MRNYTVSFILLCTFLLVGCNFSSSDESKLLDVFSAMHDAEEEFLDVQDTLTSLEKSEQELFNKTMELTQEQNDELKIKIAELEELLEKRLMHLEKEEASIKGAMESMTSLDELLKNAKADHKSELEALKLAVTDRSNDHAAFVIAYKELAKLQKELYEMLVAEGTELSGLQKKIEKVNEQNEVVNSAIISFNKSTVAVNDLKDRVLAHFAKTK